MNRSTLHTFDDKRGNRDVYVDGVQIACCVMADVLRGVVEYHPMPLQMDKSGKRIVTRFVHGSVEVVLHESA